jgi:hypothetical protein
MNDRRFLPLLVVALAAGCGIAWIDSRPHWDDTGITAGMVLATSALLSAMMPARAAVFALAVGAWIPLIGIIQQGNNASMLALPISFVGAFIGSLIGRQRRGGAGK